MRIEIVRRWLKNDYTIDILMIDGKVFCDCLEDTDRGIANDMPWDYIASKKVYGKTAIPTGEYKCTYKYSPSFKRKMLYIDDIPCFTNVMFHYGNTPSDTLGCILLGSNTMRGMVLDSRKTIEKFNKLVEETLKKGEEITLGIHY